MLEQLLGKKSRRNLLGMAAAGAITLAGCFIPFPASTNNSNTSATPSTPSQNTGNSTGGSSSGGNSGNSSGGSSGGGQITYDALQADVGSDRTIDEGNCTTLNGRVSGGKTPYSFVWKIHDTQNIFSNSREVEVCPDSSVSYEFVVTDSLGKKATDVMSVVVNPDLDDDTDRDDIKDYPNKIINTIGVNRPMDIAFTNDGAFAYVASSGNDSIDVIKTSDNIVTYSIPVGKNPSFIVLSNNSYGYVSNWGDGTVSVIRTIDNQIVDTIPVGNRALGIDVTSDNRFVYVATDGENDEDSVSVINTANRKVVNTIPLTGKNPTDLVIASDDAHVYVSNYSDNTVDVIRTSDNTIVDNRTVGVNPTGIAISPNNDYVYVANWASSIGVIRTSDNEVVDYIAAKAGDLNLSPDGRFLYAAGDNIYVINTNDNSILEEIVMPIGGEKHVALSANKCYVSAPNENKVYVLEK